MAFSDTKNWDMRAVKLEDFEGPLDLLLYLIEKNKVNIYDIPIALITDQYMDYIYSLNELDMEEASSFIVVAATLMHIKTKMMLPTPGDDEEEDPREELVRSLELYKRYKLAAGFFKERESVFGGTLTKQPERLPVKTVYDNAELAEGPLTAAYRDVLRRYDERAEFERKPKEQTMKREKVSMRRVIKDVVKYISSLKHFIFSEMYSTKKCERVEVVAAFMALLELARVQRVSVTQQDLFGEIRVDATVSGSDGETDITDIGGFEEAYEGETEV